MSGALTAGVIGVGMSLYQGHKAQGQAQQLADQQQRETEAAQAESKRQYEAEQAMWKPAKERLISEGMAETPSDYGKYVDLVHQRYGEATRQANERPLGTSGLGAAHVQGAQLAQASDLARAYTEAKDRQREMLARLLPMDRSAAMGQGYTGTMTNAANMYGQQAGIAGSLAGQAYGAAAGGIAGIAGELGRRSMAPDIPPPPPGGPGTPPDGGGEPPIPTRDVAPESLTPPISYESLNYGREPMLGRPDFPQQVVASPYAANQPQPWSAVPMQKIVDPYASYSEGYSSLRGGQRGQ